MRRITKLRTDKKWSKLLLSQEAHVAPCIVSSAENGRRQLYLPEARRLSEALGWTGDPLALMDEVTACAEHVSA